MKKHLSHAKSDRAMGPAFFCLCLLFAVYNAQAEGISIPYNAQTRLAAVEDDTARIEGQVGGSSNLIDLAQASQANITNAQIVTVTHSVMRFGSAAGEGTNVINLADPGPGVAGRMAFIYNAAATNWLSVTNGGNWKAATVVVAPLNGMYVFAVATNAWCGK